MVNDKQRKADILFDAIGEIDDRFIFEASAPAPQRASSPIFRRLAVVGISLALVFTLGVSAVVAAMIGRSLNKGAADEPPQASSPTEDNTPDTLPTVNILESFASIKSSTSDLSAEMKEIDLLDKKARLIWKYSDEESYRVLLLSSDDLYKISSMLKQTDDTSEINRENNDSKVEGIWICYSDGTVVSPCLKLSNGNIGYADLFEYAPEIEPSASLTEFLIDLIKEQKQTQN